MNPKTFPLAAAAAWLLSSCLTAAAPPVEVFAGAAVTGTAAPENVPPGPLTLEALAGNYWVTRPSGGSQTVVGIAGRRLNRDEAIELALADAARRVAVYHGLRGRVSTALSQGANALEFYAGSSCDLVLDHEPDEFVGSLRFDPEQDVVERNGAVYVRAAFEGVPDSPVYATTLSGGVPDWVTAYRADLPGWLAGVGVARNKGAARATYQASYENALAAMLGQLDTRVMGADTDAAGRRMTRTVTVSEGALDAALILETWFDDRTGSVWTLAAARERSKEVEHETHGD